MGREQEVDPIVGLERAQVEIVVQLADHVDPDHVAERLDDAQVRVGSLDDPAGVAELRSGERERGRGLADPRRPVEEERVRVPVRESGGQQPLCLVLLRHLGKRISGRPPTTDRSSGTESRLSPARLDRGRDPLGQVLGRKRPVEHEVPVGETGGELPYAPATRAWKPSSSRSIRSRSTAIRAAASSEPISSRIVRSGIKPLDGGEVELEHALEPETPRDSLIGDRRVDVAIADHRHSSRERGPDHLLDVLGSRGCVQRGLGPRRDVASVQHEVADLLPERRAARLARQRRPRLPRPRGARASSVAWVVLPEPSRPSRVMNIAGRLRR